MGEIIEPTPIVGPVEAVEVGVLTADAEQGAAMIAGWRRQLEQWGCRVGEEPYPGKTVMDCGRFSVGLRHNDITRRAYLEAEFPEYGRCWA